jgi:hypothetical protein
MLNYCYGLKKFLLNENVEPPTEMDKNLLESSQTYFSDIQWAYKNGKYFQPKSQTEYKNLVLNSSNVQ